MGDIERPWNAERDAQRDAQREAQVREAQVAKKRRYKAFGIGLAVVIIGGIALGIYVANDESNPCGKARSALHEYNLSVEDLLADEAARAWEEYRYWSAKCETSP
jgi:hypothetical protein